MTTNTMSVDCLKCGTTFDVDLVKRMARAMKRIQDLLRREYRQYGRVQKDSYAMAIEVALADNEIPVELHEVIKILYRHRKNEDAIGRPGFNWSYGILNSIGEWGHACRS